MKKIPKLRFKEFNGEWEKKIINEFTKVYDGTHYTPTYVDKGIPFYSVEHVTSNQFENTKFIHEDIFEKENKRVKLEMNDILMTKIGDIGSSRLLDWDVKASFYVSLALIKHNNQNSSCFINQQIKSSCFQKQLHSKTLHVAFPKKINLGEIGACYLLFPTLPEQTKIANFLTSTDKKIELLTKKETLLKKYKKGIMQKIFNQEIRFKADDGSEFEDWQERRLGEFLIHKTTRNKNKNCKLVLSVSNKKGFITQDEQFDGYEVASNDLSNYKIVEKEEYAYNPARINVGSIARLKNFDNGIVSPMYVVFEVRDELNKNFFDNLYKTYSFKHMIKIGCSGSVRDSLNFDDLANFKVKFPTLPEQTKIANFLTSIDSKIELLQKQLSLTKDFKKGLLQVMFV